MLNNTKGLCSTESALVMQEPMLSDLGCVGDTPDAEATLGSAYVTLPGADELTKGISGVLNAPS